MRDVLKGNALRLIKALRYKEGNDTSANACIDALIWVGSSPKKTETVNEYLKEAKLRGCCRRLPRIPSWAEFGKTKVFLAHRGKHKVPSRGSIFGYFVLHRIEIITKDEVAKSLSNKEEKAPLPRNIEQHVKRIKKWDEEGYSEQEIEDMLEERLEEEIEEFIVDLAGGKTPKKTRPRLDDEITELIEPFIDLIDRVTKKIVKSWSKCFPPAYSTQAEGHRMCSIRNGSGAVYAVDALCATIHDTYQQKLQKRLEGKKSGERKAVLEGINQKNQESWEEWVEKDKKNHRWTVKELLEMYKGPFHGAVKKHFRSGRKPKYPIDQRLKGKARHYGELVVFKKPFPILEKEPQAAFLGVCHIDGDKLIDQIANHRGKKALVPKIYYCNGELQQIATKKELVTWLTQELHVSSACAARFLDEMAQTTRDQLEEFNKFKLPGIGTIRLKEKRGQKKITFYPFKTLRSIKPQKN
jgi:nucleoid DNA-binding protein